MNRVLGIGYWVLGIIIGVAVFASVSFAGDVDARTRSIVKKNIMLLNDKAHEHDAALTLISLRESAVPALSEVAKNPNEKLSLRLEVIDILGDIRSPDAIDSLLGNLKDP